jgi:hypothetical protein
LGPVAGIYPFALPSSDVEWCPVIGTQIFNVEVNNVAITDSSDKIVCENAIVPCVLFSFTDKIFNPEEIKFNIKTLFPGGTFYDSQQISISIICNNNYQILEIGFSAPSK